MIAKRHFIDNKTLLAVCDKEHLGKTFEEGELSFTVSIRFYGGEAITAEELRQALKESDSVNLFGNTCVEIAIKEGLVSEKGTLSIAGIKHAQIYHI